VCISNYVYGKWILDRGKVIQWNQEGKPLRVIGIHSDITQRKKIEERIQEQNIQLQELNSTKDKFFSIIAHDLRSPFSGFIGLTKFMADGIMNMDKVEVQKMSIAIQETAQNLFKLLENLLEWSRIQRGMIPFDPSFCIVSFLIEPTIELMRGSLTQKNIELVNQIPQKFALKADVFMLNTILRNLISNAIKFTQRGGKIILSAEEQDSNYLFLVEDSGIGMSSNTVGKLFKIDQKVSRLGTEGEHSTGLGLILCKEFINKHGGKIWVESEIAVGSKFYFTIPKYFN